MHYSRFLRHGDPYTVLPRSGGDNTAHGGKGQRLYIIWKGMRQRCNNPNSNVYPRWGGRGITITPAWDDYAVFRDWAYANGYEDQPEGTAYRDKLTIDRIDNDGDYEPSNCRWIPRHANAAKDANARKAR